MELVLTAYRYREKDLLRELEGLGRFRGTGFRDVLRGEVEDLEAFLEGLERQKVLSLARLTPVVKAFKFDPGSVCEEFKSAAKPLIDGMGEGETFCVKVSRRGLKGVFSSQEVAREVGTFFFEALKEKFGVEPKVDLKDPDKAVVFETLGTWCGVGVIAKAMRRRCPYLRLP